MPRRLVGPISLHICLRPTSFVGTVRPTSIKPLLPQRYRTLIILILIHYLILEPQYLLVSLLELVHHLAALFEFVFLGLDPLLPFKCYLIV